MKKLFFVLATAALLFMSCDGVSTSGPSYVEEEEITATDSVALQMMSRSLATPLKYDGIIDNAVDGLATTIYKAEKDGKIVVYSDLQIKLDSVYATPGFKENMEPRMDLTYLPDGGDFTDLPALKLTEASKQNLITFLGQGQKGDVLTLRFQSEYTADDYAKLTERISVNYMDLRVEEPVAETTEEEQK